MAKFRFGGEVPAHDVRLDSLSPVVTVTVPYGYLEFIVEAASLKEAIETLEDHFFGVDYLGEVA